MIIGIIVVLVLAIIGSVTTALIINATKAESSNCIPIEHEWSECSLRVNGLHMEDRKTTCPDGKEARLCDPAIKHCKVSDWSDYLTPEQVLGANESNSLVDPNNKHQQWKIILGFNTDDEQLYKIRKRTMIQDPTVDGDQCPPLIDFELYVPPTIGCETGEWKEVQDCAPWNDILGINTSDKRSYTLRERNALTSVCQPHDLRELELCAPEECVWDDWSEWSNTCGMYKDVINKLNLPIEDDRYYKTRHRTVKTDAKYGGAPCKPEDQVEFDLCDLQFDVYENEYDTVMIGPSGKMSSRCPTVATSTAPDNGHCLFDGYNYNNNNPTNIGNMIDYNPDTKKCDIKKCEENVPGTNTLDPKLYFPRTNNTINAPNESKITISNDSSMNDFRLNIPKAVLSAESITESNCPTILDIKADLSDCMHKSFNLGANTFNHKHQDITVQQFNDKSTENVVDHCVIKQCDDPNNLMLSEPNNQNITGDTKLGYTVYTTNPNLNTPVKVSDNAFKKSILCDDLGTLHTQSLNQCIIKTFNAGGNAFNFRKLTDNGLPLGTCNMQNCGPGSSDAVPESHEDVDDRTAWDMYSMNAPLHNFRKVQHAKSKKAGGPWHDVRYSKYPNDVDIRFCDFQDIDNEECYARKMYTKPGRIYRYNDKYYKSLGDCYKCNNEDPATQSTFREITENIPPMSVSRDGYKTTLNKCAEFAKTVGANAFGYGEWDNRNGTPYGDCTLYNVGDTLSLGSYVSPTTALDIYATPKVKNITGGDPDDLIPPAPEEPDGPGFMDIANAIKYQITHNPTATTRKFGSLMMTPYKMGADQLSSTFAGLGDHIPGYGPIYDHVGVVTGPIYDAAGEVTGAINEAGEWVDDAAGTVYDTINPWNWGW
jgi:hypothetical protein